MRAHLIAVRIALAIALFGGASGCSRESPQPQNEVSDFESELLQAGQSKSSKIDAAQNWFVESSQLKKIDINWDDVQIMGDWIVAPLVDIADPFPKHGKYGYRYLVVQVKKDAQCAGRIVELVLDGSKLSAFQSAKIALDAVEPIIMGKSLGPLHKLSGWVILYSPAYEYEFGYVYEDGLLLPKKVQLNAEQVKKVSEDGHLKNQLQTGSSRVMLLQYITVTTCGYVVGGGTLFCSTDTYIIDTGAGGGSSGGTSGGGGGGTSGNWGGVGGTTSPFAEDGPLDVGDHSKWMTYAYDSSTDVKVLIEWTESTHKIEKITTTTVGLTAATTFKPLGDGTATYLAGKLANGNDLIRYTTYFQFQAGTTVTGPIQDGTIFKVYGGLNAQTGEYTINMVKVP